MSSGTGSEYDSSDEDLQEAFSTGLIQPGLNVLQENKKVSKNNIRGINQKLEQLRQKFPWIEKLSLVNGPAPLAPELALQLQEQENRRDRQLRGNKKLDQFDPSDDPVLNDFRRETLFHRQAQGAVVEGIARLKALNVATVRPEDYYAEMAKTDEHMQKVKTNLLKKQTQAQNSEKMRQMRMQRKISKQMQVEATLKKHADKRKFMEEVKKYRKGIRQDLDFLENKKKQSFKQQPNNNNTNKRALEKRNMKNSKFGFGGKKRGSKKNTKDSSADVSDYRRPGKPGKMGKFTNKSGKLGKTKGKTNSRPGKSRRVQMKAKRK